MIVEIGFVAIPGELLFEGPRRELGIAKASWDLPGRGRRRLGENGLPRSQKN